MFLNAIFPPNAFFAANMLKAMILRFAENVQKSLNTTTKNAEYAQGPRTMCTGAVSAPSAQGTSGRFAALPCLLSIKGL